jgi:hypothetical protein
MIPGGEDIRVNNSNKHRYVEAQTRRILEGSSPEALTHLVAVRGRTTCCADLGLLCVSLIVFTVCCSRVAVALQGVREVLTPQQLRLLTPSDLQVIVGGPIDIDVKKLAKLVVYDGYVRMDGYFRVHSVPILCTTQPSYRIRSSMYPTSSLPLTPSSRRCTEASRVVRWFWKWVATLTLVDKRALLVFWSGASTLPVSAVAGSVSAVEVAVVFVCACACACACVCVCRWQCKCSRSRSCVCVRVCAFVVMDRCAESSARQNM